MKELMFGVLKKFLPSKFVDVLRLFRHKFSFFIWKISGSKMPPPHRVKQLAIIEFKKKYNINTLVETGTHLGEMIEMQKNNFDSITSIELGIELYNKACQRFQKYSHITILQGDSGKVLPQIVPHLNTRALFWLDGHFSAGLTAKGNTECPVYEEIDAIFNNNKYKHIILIDDARDFTGKGDYPSINQLKEYVNKLDSTYSLKVENDMIRLTPSF